MNVFVFDKDAPPTREWLREKVGDLIVADKVTLSSIIALAAAYGLYRFDEGYEVGYSDGQNACTTDHD